MFVFEILILVDFSLRMYKCFNKNKYNHMFIQLYTEYSPFLNYTLCSSDSSEYNNVLFFMTYPMLI